MRSRRDVLIEAGYEPMKGYIFKVPHPGGDYDQVFIEESDAEPELKLGLREYFYDDRREVMHDLETAWEYFLEDYYDEHDKDFDEEVRQ